MWEMFLSCISLEGFLFFFFRGGAMLKGFIESLPEGRNGKVFSSRPSSLLPMCWPLQTPWGSLGLVSRWCSRIGNLRNSWSVNSPVLSVAPNPLQPLGLFRLVGSGSVGSCLWLAEHVHLRRSCWDPTWSSAKNKGTSGPPPAVFCCFRCVDSVWITFYRWGSAATL